MEIVAIGVLVLVFAILFVYHLRRKNEVKKEWEDSAKSGSGFGGGSARDGDDNDRLGGETRVRRKP